MRVGVLGPIEVDGGAVGLGPRDRVVLGVLAVRPGQNVSADAIAEAPHEEIIAILVRLLVPYVERWALGRVYSARAVVRARESEVEP